MIRAICSPRDRPPATAHVRCPRMSYHEGESNGLCTRHCQVCLMPQLHSVVDLDALCNTCVSVATKTSLLDGKRIRQLRKSCRSCITQEPQAETETVHEMGTRDQESPFQCVTSRSRTAQAKAGTRLESIGPVSPLPTGAHEAVVTLDQAKRLLADFEFWEHVHDMFPGQHEERSNPFVIVEALLVHTLYF